MKKSIPLWLDPYKLKPQRKADYFKNCHNCHYEGQAKVNDKQLIKCVLCLGDPKRPGWVDKVLMVKVQGARTKLLGLPKRKD